MSNTPHIQRIGFRRSTLVAAIVAATISTAAVAPSRLAGHGTPLAGQPIPMPAGGCGASGC
jgi:hypothetical protein